MIKRIFSLCLLATSIVAQPSFYPYSPPTFNGSGSSSGGNGSFSGDFTGTFTGTTIPPSTNFAYYSQSLAAIPTNTGGLVYTTNLTPVALAAVVYSLSNAVTYTTNIVVTGSQSKYNGTYFQNEWAYVNKIKKIRLWTGTNGYAILYDPTFQLVAIPTWINWDAYGIVDFSWSTTTMNGINQDFFEATTIPGTWRLGADGVGALPSASFVTNVVTNTITLWTSVNAPATNNLFVVDGALGSDITGKPGCGTPWKSIYGLPLSSMKSGDNIFVRPGFYDNYQNDIILPIGVSIIGIGGWNSVTISNATIRCSGSNNVTGLTVIQNYGHWSTNSIDYVANCRNINGLDISGTNNAIQNCVIYGKLDGLFAQGTAYGTNTVDQVFYSGAWDCGFVNIATNSLVKITRSTFLSIYDNVDPQGTYAAEQSLYDTSGAILVNPQGGLMSYENCKFFIMKHPTTAVFTKFDNGLWSGVTLGTNVSVVMAGNNSSFVNTNTIAVKIGVTNLLVDGSTMRSTNSFAIPYIQPLTVPTTWVDNYGPTR